MNELTSVTFCYLVGWYVLDISVSDMSVICWDGGWLLNDLPQPATNSNWQHEHWTQSWSDRRGDQSVGWDRLAGRPVSVVVMFCSIQQYGM